MLKGNQKVALNATKSLRFTDFSPLKAAKKAAFVTELVRALIEVHFFYR